MEEGRQCSFDASGATSRGTVLSNGKKTADSRIQTDSAMNYEPDHD